MTLVTNSHNPLSMPYESPAKASGYIFQEACAWGLKEPLKDPSEQRSPVKAHTVDGQNPA